MKKFIFMSLLFALNTLQAQKKHDYHPEFEEIVNRADSVNFKIKDHKTAIEIYKSVINTNGDFEDLLRCKLSSYKALSRIFQNTDFDGHDFNLAYMYLKKAVEARDIYRIKAGFKTKITSETDDLARDMAKLVERYPGCENGTYVSASVKVDEKVKVQPVENKKNIENSIVTEIEIKKDMAITSTQSSTNTDKTVSITVSGSGKTQDEAKQSALRSAIEQAFGAFISAKTEILNDQVISDQITSVASGNIQSFDILNAAQLPDGIWGVMLKVLVSIDKLSSFVQAKGVTIEIKGGLFALNIKQQIMNENAEFRAVCDMVALLHEPMQTAFDYTIISGEPQSKDTESKNWEITLKVSATTNKNMDFCADYCIKTLSALSLSTDEALTYRALNKNIFQVVIKYNGRTNYNGQTTNFILRNQASINVLKMLANNWDFYTRLFTVQSGMDESNGNGNGEIFNFSNIYNHPYSNEETYEINFLSTGQQAATFSWQDKRTLAQIEQMTGYTVKPRGVVSQFKRGVCRL